MKRTLPDIFDAFLENDDGRNCLKCDQDEWNRKDLYANVIRWAQLLKEIGVEPDDRVGIYLKKSLDEVGVIFAVSCIGAIFVNIHPSNRLQQLQHILQDCDIRVLVSSPELVRALGNSLRELPVSHIIVTGTVDELSFPGNLYSFAESAASSGVMPQSPRIIGDDFAAVMYTSGSTGKAKGIIQTHANLVEGAKIVSGYLDNSPKDRVLCLLPLSFDYGLNQLLSGILTGFPLVLANYLLPLDILNLLQNEDITGLAGVPTIWLDFLGVLDKYPDVELPKLRYITNSGGKLHKPTVDRLSSRLTSTDIYLMYGLTEAFRSTYLPPDQINNRVESIGKAIPNVEILVINQDGKECRKNEIGELVHRGALVSKGYWGNERKTRDVFRPNPLLSDDMGFLETVVYSGDLVWRDEEGYLYFAGRKDRMIKSAGQRISPDEIVEALLRINGVQNAAVIGVEDERLGQKIISFVQARDGIVLSESDCIAVTKTLLPPHMVPSKIVFMERLPVNKNGKVDLKKLEKSLVKT
jgi:acyl-CoA ligase (AMP-forming) (exosortase A-associated)